MRRGRTGIAAATVLIAGIVAVCGSVRTATSATTCNLVPQLRDVTVNQGVGSYSPLQLGKETLVRLYLSMPSCAASGASVQVTGATLTVSGASQSTPVPMTPTPQASAYPTISTFSVAPIADSTGDPSFIVPGSGLSPTSGAGFTARFTATVNSQSKASRNSAAVAGPPQTFSFLPTSLTNPAPSTTPIQAAFDKTTNPFHVLVVPMGDPTKTYSSQFSAAAQAAVQDGMTATVGRIFPVASGVGNLGSTRGEGLQYTITPTLLDLKSLGLLDSNGRFCGTGASYNAIKGTLFQMLRAWQTGNPGLQVDSVLGEIDPLIARGPPDPCFEGMGVLGSAETWAQAITGRAGQLAGLELAHTLGLVPKDRESPFDAGHSQNITAENPPLNRRFNLVQRTYIPTDRSLMKPSASAPAPDNVNTLFEAPDFAYARAVFGGTANSEFTQFPKTLGSITAATLAFVMSGTTDGSAGIPAGSTGQATGTNVVESYFSSQTQLTQPDTTSGYFLRQMPSGTVTGVAVGFVDSEHGGNSTSHGAPAGLFSTAQATNPNTTRIEFWKGQPGASGSLLLYARDQNTAPVINGMSTGSPIVLLRSGTAPSVSPRTDVPQPPSAAKPARTHGAPARLRTTKVRAHRTHGAARLVTSLPRAAWRPTSWPVPFLKWTGLDPVFTVDSTGDGDDSNLADNLCNDGTGKCTLRAAIEQLNAIPGADTINFGIGASGSSQTIAVGSTALPQITDPVTIDGLTQGGTGYSGPPLIELNGAASPGDGLTASAQTTIRGLVINRFPGTAVNLVSGPAGSTVEDNFIGTSAAGNENAGNGGGGVRTYAGAVVIQNNVISGNNFGVALISDGNAVSSNLIGTNAAGTAAIGNVGDGIELQASSSNVIQNNVISGTTLTNGASAGIDLFESATQSNNNIISGNKIGTDVTGSVALPNGRRGIMLNGASSNTIRFNVISGNTGDGIDIANSSQQNAIFGNLIGVAADQTSALGNSGFGIQMNSSLNTIGEAGGLGRGNTIANNGGDGIVITGGTGNDLCCNRFYSNASLGINLSNDLVTANDPGDTDTGANNLQNFPVLTSATLSGGNLVLTGTLDTNASLANPNFRLEAFLNSSCDPSGNGEGETFVGSATITVDGSGHVGFTQSFPTATSGNYATVTATAAGTGDTSEFSPCTIVDAGGGGGTPQTGPTFTVNTADDHSDAGGCTTDDCSLREAIAAANAHPNGSGPDQIVFGITTGGTPHTISATSPLPAVVDRVTIDGADANIVDGASAGASVSGLVFAAGSGDSSVTNLQIQNFASYQIDLKSSGNTVGNTIGGLDTDGNLLLGHGGLLVESGSDENVIAGNNIGFNPASGAVNAGSGSGVEIDGASGNVIGDDISPPGHANLHGDMTNVIVGFGNGGVYLNGADATKVDGNRIGTNRAGATTMGNNKGVIVTGSGGNTIGPDNEIARNTGIGVDVGIAGNRIVGNSIHDNGGVGIHDDASVGMQPPTLTSATKSGSTTTINGTFSGAPNSSYFIEFFNNAACDPSGSGEGQTYIGPLTGTANTNGSGNASFSFATNAPALGDVVTATATKAFGDSSTSQFSNCQTVANAGPPPGPGQEPVTVTATDDHPADMRVDLFLDCGAGKPKLPIAVGLKPASAAGTSASFSYNYDPSLACPNGTLKAVGNDGFTSTGFTTAGSASVDPGPNVPRASISSPLDQKVFLTYSLIPLRGSVRDPDGELLDNQLQWTVTGPGGLTRTGTGHQIDLNPPAGGGWPTGSYTAKLVGTNAAGKTGTATATFTVKTDADNDGMPADVEGQSCFTTGDNDPLNAYSDYDGDGIPNSVDPQACTPATSYTATADFNPDPLPVTSTGNTVTVNIRIPGRNVAQVIGSSVRITQIADADVSTDPRFQNIAWTVANDVGTAKFDRQKLVQYLAGRNIHNRTISITVAGRSGAPPWTFQGSDTTFVQG
jgi:CSLREA domain-containing protein